MAGVFSTTYKDIFLDQIPSTMYVKLHTGDPGSAGTANPSSETTRKAVTFAASSGGSRVGTGGTVSWAPIALSGTENLTHYSLWSSATVGVMGAYGSLTTPRNGVNNGDTVNITPSDFTFAINNP